LENLQIHIPSKIITGENEALKLHEYVRGLGNKAVFITSRDLFPDSDIIDRILNSLKKNNINVLLFDDVTPDADSELVDDIATLTKSARCDFVIGLGGDIVLNTARAVSLVCSNPGSSSDYLTEAHGYRLKITRAPLPSVMMPSSFGTLNEVNPGFVIKDKEDGMRKKLYSERVCPTIIILDPILTQNISQKYLAASGLLLLSYAIDLFVSPTSNILTDMFAQKTVDVVKSRLAAIIKDSENLQLRADFMTASLMVSYGAACGRLGAIYTLSESLASISNVYKGSIAAIMLPQFMEYNLTSASPKYVQISRVLGEDIKDISVLEAAIKAVERVRRFVEEFNLPHRLRDLGLKSVDIEEIWATFSRFEESKAIPREITKSDLLTVIEQSL
jgi:alcohol dehydrogenase class IV